MNNLKLIEDVLCYIDEHLKENITFEYLADVFGYSSFHFHKIFSSVTGQTITGYLRKRRLMYAHIELCDTEKTITDICYDNGFGSIQSFNRIFKITYGMLPSDVRKQNYKIDYKSVQTIIEGYTKRIHFKGEYIMEPRFAEKNEFILVGSRKYTGNGFQVIGEAWQELKTNWDKIKRKEPNIMYGFEDYSEDFSKEPLQFYYMAAVEVESDIDIPDGMHIKKIPKSYYAIFTVNGNNVNGEIGKAFRYIYDVWLPSSEYCLSNELCADFEYYDERWDCQSSSAQMDLYIPVKKLVNEGERRC